MIFVLAAVALAAIGALVYVIHTASRERQTLLDRIQAPEKVISERISHGPMLEAVHPEDDSDYWKAHGIDEKLLEHGIEVPH